MLLDARSVTALRTGAVAAVATQTLAREDARTVGLIGCGLHGAWAARCLVAAGYGPGVCHDPREDVAAVLADELSWRTGSRAEAIACDVVCCVTPGTEIVIDVGSLRAGLHLNMLGADGPGKAEASVGAVASCVLFCDEWAQASHGGELTGAVNAGLVTRDRVTELGAVLAGDAPGRPGPEAVTLFDSTGLAIQDLAVAIAAFDAWEDNRIEAAFGHALSVWAAFIAVTFPALGCRFPARACPSADDRAQREHSYTKLVISDTVRPKD